MDGTARSEGIPVVTSLQEVDERELIVAYRHQRGHQSTWAGRDDFAYWNGRADKAATQTAGSG